MSIYQHHFVYILSTSIILFLHYCSPKSVASRQHLGCFWEFFVLCGLSCGSPEDRPTPSTLSAGNQTETNDGALVLLSKRDIITQHLEEYVLPPVDEFV